MKVSHKLLSRCKSVIKEVIRWNIIEMFGWVKVKKAFQEVHERICATHASGHMTARQIQRSGIS
jgi:hypothetical protein